METRAQPDGPSGADKSVFVRPDGMAPVKLCFAIFFSLAFFLFFGAHPRIFARSLSVPLFAIDEQKSPLGIRIFRDASS